ncbi:MAG TPA: hypothetical protein EYG92_02165 [Lutibacter sp.]|nr:hypothetical protein [Lutibacter sp.]
MKNTILFGIIVLLLLSNCKKEETEDIADFVFGKNRYTTVIDNETREYYVHVPSNYNKNTPLPVVFMLHGTTGNGEKFYNISGWKEVGETENVISVYPSSGKYCIEQDGVIKNITKWNVFYPDYTYCNGDVPLDDIKFLRQVVTEIKDRFSVNSKRIYLAGFSNGGQMAFRCAVEMSDLIAAVVQSAGSVPSEIHTYNAMRNIPVSFQMGNSDETILGDGVVIPMTDFENLLTTNPMAMHIIEIHAATFNFETNYIITGDPNFALTATFKAIPFQNNRVFKISMINGLGHNYPNGINHSAMGAEINWEWMKQYSLP